MVVLRCWSHQKQNPVRQASNTSSVIQAQLGLAKVTTIDAMQKTKVTGPKRNSDLLLLSSKSNAAALWSTIWVASALSISTICSIVDVCAAGCGVYEGASSRPVVRRLLPSVWR